VRRVLAPGEEKKAAKPASSKSANRPARKKRRH